MSPRATKPPAPSKKAPMVTATEAEPTQSPLAGLVEGRHVFYEDHDGTHAAVVAKVLPVYDGTPGVPGYLEGSVNLSVLGFDGQWYGALAIAPGFDQVDDKWLQNTWRWMFKGQGPHMLQPGAASPQYAK